MCVCWGVGYRNKLLINVFEFIFVFLLYIINRVVIDYLNYKYVYVNIFFKIF